jgi:hypothetical protein
VDFLKLFDTLDIDGSFLTRRSVHNLASWLIESCKDFSQNLGMLSAISIVIESAQTAPSRTAMESNRFLHILHKKKGLHFLTLKICIETTLEDFARKMCDGYF